MLFRHGLLAYSAGVLRTIQKPAADTGFCGSHAIPFSTGTMLKPLPTLKVGLRVVLCNTADEEQ
jgi:hypothetical protein